MTCASAQAPPSYTASVARAVASNRDLWGEQLLRAPGGPTLAAASSHLAPLTQGLQWQGQPLTASGAYYLPFSFPFTTHGSTVFALHAADGSEILTRRFNGPSLTIDVGSGTERYGSCGSRLRPAHLVDGYLPILDTAYEDTDGVHYTQESFVGRVNGKAGTRSVISFVRLSVDARHAQAGATVRLVPSEHLVRSGPDRLSLGRGTRLIVSRGAQLAGGIAAFHVRAGTQTTIYAEWLNAPSVAPHVHASAATYRRARKTVVAFWRSRLAAGATIDVPEPAVEDAIEGVLTQLIAYGWRYSIGNPYEELSYDESLDAAEVATELGYAPVAKGILQFALERMQQRPWRFTAFRGAHILSTAALYVRLTGDRAFLRAATPELTHLVDRIAARQGKGGSLLPEPLSTDLQGQDVDSVSGQIEAVEGLRALARVWSTAGDTAHAARARLLASSIDRALRPAVARASVRLADGSLFVPDQLPQKPFQRLTASKDASYWNLIMPSAFASGWFPAQTSTTAGILRYLLDHGSRLLGLPRTYAHSVYGNEPGAGVAPVYELGLSRFLAAEDKPGLLDVSLYGLLAAGLTRGTYISGEAVSLLPVKGAYDRAMFMPPNTGANASFLGTVRELLVHERLGPGGAPVGLDLAFSTPQAWLAPGKRIEVKGLLDELREGVLLTCAARLDNRRPARAAARVPLPAAAAGSRRSAGRVRVGWRGPHCSERVRDDHPRRPARRFRAPRGHPLADAYAVSDARLEPGRFG